MCRTYRTPPRSQTGAHPDFVITCPGAHPEGQFFPRHGGLPFRCGARNANTRCGCLGCVVTFTGWPGLRNGGLFRSLAHCACSFHVERLQNAKTTTAHAPIRRGTLHRLGLKPTIHGYDLESTARPKCANCRHLRQTSLRTIRPTNAIDRRNRRQTRSHHLNHRQNVEQRQRVERRGQELTTGWCGALETSSRRIPTATTIPTA